MRVGHEELEKALPLEDRLAAAAAEHDHAVEHDLGGRELRAGRVEGDRVAVAVLDADAALRERDGIAVGILDDELVAVGIEMDVRPCLSVIVMPPVSSNTAEGLPSPPCTRRTFFGSFGVVELERVAERRAEDAFGRRVGGRSHAPGPIGSGPDRV
jgi:hypothetical protein